MDVKKRNKILEGFVSELANYGGEDSFVKAWSRKARTVLNEANGIKEERTLDCDTDWQDLYNLGY